MKKLVAVVFAAAALLAIPAGASAKGHAAYGSDGCGKAFGGAIAEARSSGTSGHAAAGIGYAGGLPAAIGSPHFFCGD